MREEIFWHKVRIVRSEHVERDHAMRLIIEARIDGDVDASMPISLGVVERTDNDLTPGTLGLSLQEGRELLRRIQEVAVSAQTARWLAGRSKCPECGIELSRKDNGTIVCRTVFGKVRLNSPRFVECWCRTPYSRPFGFSFSPLAAVLRQRVTGKLEQLQVEWAAQQPYRSAVRLLGQILPLTDAISVSGTRNRVLAVGRALDEQSERQIENLPAARRLGVECPNVSVVAVDSVWLKHREYRMQGRQLNVVAGRATFAEGGTSLYGYVTRRVSSGAKRLDLFLSQQGVGPNERVTAITDGACEFDVAAAGSALTGAQVLDWFHIAMKFRAAQMSAVMLSLQSPAQWRPIERSLDATKWLVWHGKAHMALERLQAILDIIEAMPRPKQDTSR